MHKHETVYTHAQPQGLNNIDAAGNDIKSLSSPRSTLSFSIVLCFGKIIYRGF
ncbi:hypothetical protein [Microcoleus sp. D3_18_C2]|uniref:hypothetical protein n=1 Tax=Microcoleus sp. D3_18_C2 TaxID=3055334 RepID=UPI002FD6443C